MQQSNLKRIVILSFVMLVLFLQNTMAHPLGLTFTNMKYSKENLTLSTRIFYADFYYEFMQYTKVKNKDYIKAGIDANDKKDFTNYFKKNLRVWINNSELKIKSFTISFEQHEEDAYILIVDFNYNIEIRQGAKIKIKDTILLRTIGGQKHVFNVYLKDPNVLSHDIITLDKSNPEYVFVNN
ncbi:MAG: DUF6702 family protein [Paludibacter sp.]